MEAPGFECELCPGEALPTEVLKKIYGLTPEARLPGYLSPIHPVNLNEEGRAASDIPKTAVHFAWCYPFLSDWGLDSDSEDLLKDPDILFMMVGGYVYLDSDFK